MTPYTCIKCGDKHGMGIEDMKHGTWEPIEYCKSCLFEKIDLVRPIQQIILDEDMQIEKMKEIMARTENKIVTEFGSSMPFRVLPAENVGLYDANDNQIMCVCGKPATESIMGKESFVAKCAECFYVGDE